MMFNVSKIALAVAATLAATSALATTAIPNSTTGGELTLVVFDATTSQAYARGLGVTMSQLVTEGDLGSNNSNQTGPKTLAVSAAVSAALNTGADANLTAFLATSGAKTYMVVADWNQGTGLANGGTAGNYLSTTTKNLYNGGIYVNGATTNSDSLGFNNFPSAANSINAAIIQSNVGNAIGDMKSVGSSRWGAAYAGVTGVQNLANWFNTGFGITGQGAATAAAGTATGLYIIASNDLDGIDPGATGGTYTSNVYYLGTENFNASTGALSFTSSVTSAVPVPAAVWLLGSGLLGLAGVGRRKAKV